MAPRPRVRQVVIASVLSEVLNFWPKSRGVNFLQTVRKLSDEWSADRISRPITAQSEKNTKNRALRDYREPRMEFSHGLLEFCTR